MHQWNVIRTGIGPDEADRTLILLHGRGGSPHDMIDLAAQLVEGKWHLAAPQATNGTWYPYSFMAPRDQNEPWLSSAIDTVHRLIRETLAVMPSHQIHILGFSQGACLAAECVARRPMKYGGLYCFTGGLIGDAPDRNSYKGDLAGTPIYLSNSDNDPHVPLERSEETREIFQAMGAEVTLQIFPGRPHTITTGEIVHVRGLLDS